MVLRTAAIASQAGLVAAIIALGAFATGSAQAAPSALAHGIADPSEGEVVLALAQYGWGGHEDYSHRRGHDHHRGWGGHHRGWGHEHHGWHHRHHDRGHRHGGHRGYDRY